MHIPKFLNWLAEHAINIECTWPDIGQCLLCVFKRDAAKYWKKEKPYIEPEHDKNFKEMLKQMPKSGKFEKWAFFNVSQMADCTEFFEWLVNHGFPYHASFSNEIGGTWGYW
jgi:hypothetical protein